MRSPERGEAESKGSVEEMAQQSKELAALRGAWLILSPHVVVDSHSLVPRDPMHFSHAQSMWASRVHPHSSLH